MFEVHSATGVMGALYGPVWNSTGQETSYPLFWHITRSNQECGRGWKLLYRISLQNNCQLYLGWFFFCRKGIKASLLFSLLGSEIFSPCFLKKNTVLYLPTWAYQLHWWLSPARLWVSIKGRAAVSTAAACCRVWKLLGSLSESCKCLCHWGGIISHSDRDCTLKGRGPGCFQTDGGRQRAGWHSLCDLGVITLSLGSRKYFPQRKVLPTCFLLLAMKCLRLMNWLQHIFEVPNSQVTSDYGKRERSKKWAILTKFCLVKTLQAVPDPSSMEQCQISQPRQ